MKICSKCGKEYDDSMKFCKEDGTKLEYRKISQTKKLCSSCGAVNSSDTKFCTSCGDEILDKIYDWDKADSGKLVYRCNSCDKIYPDWTKFCPDCGGIITSKTTEIPEDFVLVEGNNKIKDFYISKFTVTQKLWKNALAPIYKKKMYLPSYFKGDNRPVDNMSWYDAVWFCNVLSMRDRLEPCYEIDIEKPKAKLIKNKNGYRLPTIAEWDYAAFGGKYNMGYEFSGSNNPNEVGWFEDNSNGETHDIGLLKPNELGLYDMSGNVYEWCEDSSWGNHAAIGLNYDTNYPDEYHRRSEGIKKLTEYIENYSRIFDDDDPGSSNNGSWCAALRLVRSK